MGSRAQGGLADCACDGSAGRAVKARIAGPTLQISASVGGAGPESLHF